MVHLIAGRAGCGKSRLIYRMAEEAIRAGRRAYLIVPDQATFQTELELARRLPGGGMAGSGVLSFSRLCDRVLAQTSGARRPVLSERGAVMAVSSLLLENREAFSTFGGYAASPGFAAMLYAQLCELRRFSIRPVHLLSTGSPRARDIAIVMQAYEESFLSRYTDAVGRMEMMVERIPLAPMLKGAHVFIDGFEMVTDQLLRAVEAIMKTAEDVTISFRLGQENDRDFPIFETEYSHYRRMERAALRAGQPIHPIPLYGGATDFRQRSPMLRHMERELFALPKNVYDGPYDDAILIREAAGARQEAAAAARHICHLVRKEGLRYRDIFVQLCDPSLTGLLREEFAAHGIPCFLDEKRPVMSRLVSRFALGLVSCAVFGLRRDDVLSLIKTGLFPLSQGEAARVQAWFTRTGARFLSAAAVERAEDDALRAVLSAIHTPIAALRARLGRGTAAEGARAFYALLSSFEGSLSAFFADLAEEDLESADAERMAYAALMDILTQMDANLSRASFTPVEFYQTLRAGLLAEEIAVLPPTADCVSVGDLERSRAASVECLLVLGANDGFLPHAIRPTGILPEGDKERMTQAGLWLGNGVTERMAEEEWTIYGAFCKPKRQLYISYSTLDGRGAARARSPVVSDLLSLFPKLSVSPAESYQSAAGRGVTPLAAAQSAHGAAAAYARGEAVSPEFSTLYRAALEELRLTDEAPSPAAAGLRPPSAEALFLREDRVFATMMERYARCPFAHFIDYGLRPEEQPAPGVAPRERGDILHSVMERVSAGRTDWSLDEAAIRALAERETRAVFFAQPRMDSPRDAYQLSQLIRLAQQACLSLFAQMTKGRFAPVLTEFRRELPLVLPGRARPIRLVGKIDRVDAAVIHGRRYIRVVDYKSGRARYDETSLSRGTDLQLPLYAAAAREALDARVAGMFLMPIGAGSTGRLDGVALGEEAVIEAMDASLGPGQTSAVLPVGKKKDGSFTAASALREQADLDAMLTGARARALDLVKQMLEGEIAPHPDERVDPCRFCPYGGVCRYGEPQSEVEEDVSHEDD